MNAPPIRRGTAARQGIHRPLPYLVHVVDFADAVRGLGPRRPALTDPDNALALVRQAAEAGRWVAL